MLDRSQECSQETCDRFTDTVIPPLRSIELECVFNYVILWICINQIYGALITPTKRSLPSTVNPIQLITWLVPIPHQMLMLCNMT